VTLSRFKQALAALAVSSLTLSAAQAQSPPDQNKIQNPDQGANQSQPANPSPAFQRAAIQATDGRYVAPNGTIDGSNLKQFLNSGADVSPTDMEEASIPADNAMQMPESVNNRAEVKAEERAAKAAQAQANGQVASNTPPKKQKKYHAHPILGAIGQPFVSTLNFMGFPVGLNEDKGIDSSLSADLPESVRKRDGAYNPNAKPGSQENTNKWFGQ
jgi:hypothetical protein